MTAAKARVLASDVHIHLEDGTLILEGGSVFDEKYAEFVTNPACFVDGDEPAEVVTTPTPAVVTQTDEEIAAAKVIADAKVAADAEAEAAKVTADAAAEAAKVAATNAAPTEVVDYATLAFPALQALAKSRDLSAGGNAAAITARLEADDRDKKIAAATAAASA